MPFQAAEIDRAVFERQVVAARKGRLVRDDVDLHRVIIPGTYPDHSCSTHEAALGYCAGVFHASESDVSRAYIIDTRLPGVNAYLVERSGSTWLSNVADMLPQLFADEVLAEHKQEQEMHARFAAARDQNMSVGSVVAIVGGVVLLFWLLLSQR